MVPQWYTLACLSASAKQYLHASGMGHLYPLILPQATMASTSDPKLQEGDMIILKPLRPSIKSQRRQQIVKNIFFPKENDVTLYQFFEGRVRFWQQMIYEISMQAGWLYYRLLNKCKPRINAEEIELSETMTFDSLMALIGEDEAVLA